MPAQGKISLDASQYTKTLEELKRNTKRTSEDMTKDVAKFGKEVAKGGQVAGVVAGQIGGTFGKLGGVISGIVSGPVAALSAGIAALVAVAVETWDRMTLSAEEYTAKLNKTASMEAKRLDLLKASQKEEADYMTRLSELAEREELGNAEKAEAVRLVDLLTSKYGDLGISINDVTGEIEGLTAATEKLNEKQRAAKIAQIDRVIASEQEKSGAAAREYFTSGGAGWLGKFQDWAFGGGGAKSADWYNSMSTRGKMESAQENLATATTKAEISFWSEEIDRLEKILSLEEERNNLKKAGVSTVKEEVAELQKASEAEKKRREEAAEADRRYWAEQEKLIEENQRAEQKAAEAEKKRLDEIAAARRRAEERRADKVQSLRDFALRATGQGRQADIDAAVWEETKAKGANLTGDEYERVVEMVNARGDLESALKRSITNSLDYAPRVNSLIARGGSEAPVKMPEMERLQQRSLNEVSEIKRLAKSILDSVDDWLTI